MKKNENIILEVQDMKKEFSLNHAERILRMSKNGGWKLPKNSPFEFNIKDGIKYKRDNRNIKES